MYLARIVPGNPGFDRRTFECSKCQHTDATLVRVQIGRGQWDSMQTDPLIVLYRRIRKHTKIEDKADRRRDFAAVTRQLQLLRPLIEEEEAMTPQSDAGAGAKLRRYAEIARVGAKDVGDAATRIATAARRVAESIAAATHTGRDIADLRALLSDAERIDREIMTALAPSLRGVIAWLARPKLIPLHAR
jgi:hypothetical protein